MSLTATPGVKVALVVDVVAVATVGLGALLAIARRMFDEMFNAVLKILAADRDFSTPAGR